MRRENVLQFVRKMLSILAKTWLRFQANRNFSTELRTIRLHRHDWSKRDVGAVACCRSVMRPKLDESPLHTAPGTSGHPKYW
jgi:hypothetical protein